MPKYFGGTLALAELLKKQEDFSGTHDVKACYMCDADMEEDLKEWLYTQRPIRQPHDY